MVYKNIVFFCLLILLSSQIAIAENETEAPEHDTLYYKTFPDDITLRLYYSQKFTGFNVSYEGLNEVLRYQPNTTRNLGVGATYKWATLNLAYGFDFMNPDVGNGETRYLDLQTHQYFDDWNFDFYGQFYEGYFLSNTPAPPIQENTYVRPDLRVIELGTTVQYVLNSERFNFKAAFINTDYQKKSAGTLLFGGDIFFAAVNSDSVLTPFFYSYDLDPEYRSLRFLKLGPSAGYAYNWVIREHLYFSGSLTLSFNGGIYELESPLDKSDSYFFSVDSGIRAAAGYATEQYNFGLIYVLQNVQASSGYNNILRTGNIRLVASYRFKL